MPRRLGLVLLAALPFAPALAQPFFADDALHLERIQRARDGAEFLRGWELRGEDASAWWSPPDLAVPYFRPLVSLAFLGDHALWGYRAAGFHLTNLLLHVATVLLVHGLARALVGEGPASFAAAALFAIHPCHVEAVVWISGRTDLLATLAYVAAFRLYLAGRSATAPRGAAIASSLALFALSLLAKEMALTFPLVLLAYECLEGRQEPPGRRLRPVLLAAAVAVLYLLARHLVLPGRGLPPHPFVHAPGDADWLPHLARAVLLYAADLVLFVPPDPVVTEPFWRGHPLLLTLLGVVTAVTLASSIRAVRDPRARRFGLAWTGLTLLPVLLVSMGERFLYLPSVGYCLMVGAKLADAAPPPPARALSKPTLLIGLLLVVVALAKTLVLGQLATSARQSVDDALAVLDAAPSATSLVAIDLPAVAAIGFGQSLRLERPERGLRIEIASLAPAFLSAESGPATLVKDAGGGRLALGRPSGFFSSYLERAFLGNRPPFREGERVEREPFAITVTKVRGGTLTAFELELREPSRTVLVRGEGFRLRRLASAAEAAPPRPSR